MANEDFNSFVGQKIDGNIASHKLARNVETTFKLDRDGSFTVADYANDVGFKDTLPEGLRYNERPVRGDKITTQGTLAQHETSIERLVDKKKLAEERLAKHSDTSKGQGYAYKKEVEQFTKELENVGHDSQKHVADLIKDYGAHKDGLNKGFDDTLDKVRAHRDALVDVIKDDIKIDKAKGTITGLEKLEGHEVSFKAGKKEYKLNKDGLHLDGNKLEVNAIKALEEHEIKDISHYAKNAVADHFDTHEEVLKKAHEKAIGIMEEKTAHLESLKTKISEKTGIGEYTGKKASLTTPGGKLAAEKGVLSEAEFLKLSAPGKFFAKAKAVFKSGVTGKIQTLGGGLLVAKGAMDVFKSVGGEKGPDENDNKFAKAAIGVAEIAGGGLLMTLGGHNKVLGR